MGELGVGKHLVLRVKDRQPKKTNKPYHDQAAGSWEIQVLNKNGTEG